MMILIFRIIGIKLSSLISAKISLIIGTHLKVDKLAISNIRNALPELSELNRRNIINEMWLNLGRIIGEYYHICQYNLEQISAITNIDNDSKNNIALLKKNKNGGIIVSGHIGNWEVGPKALMARGIKINILYRPLNNPYVEHLTSNLRQKYGVKLIAKGNKGNKQIIQAIKNNEYVIILADQKITQGQPIKFFHDYANTSTFIAKIAMKYDVPIIMASVIRKKNSKFDITVNKPLYYKNLAEEKKDFNIIKFSAIINKTLEKWISKNPAQWFWVHDRWKK